MLRANGLTIERILAAGYLSPAVYYTARCWRCYGDMDPEVVLSLPPGERNELLRLAEDPYTDERLYFLERMEALLDSGDSRPEKLLAELLGDESSPAVKEYVGALGREAFLLRCVFVAEGALSPHMKEDVLFFIRRYENAFAGRVVPARRDTGNAGAGNPEREKEEPRQKEAKGETAGPEAFAGISRGTGNGESGTARHRSRGGKVPDGFYFSAHDNLPFVSRPLSFRRDTPSGRGYSTRAKADRYGAETEWTSDLVGIRDVDADAVPPGSDDVKYVIFLHGLGMEAFEPHRRKCLAYLRQNLPKRAYNVVKSLGIRDLLMNYLYAEPDKLLTLNSVGVKIAADINGARDYLKTFVARMYEDAAADAAARTDCEEGGEEPPETGKETTPEDTMGPERYALLRKKLEKLAEAASASVATAIKSYRGNFIENYVLGTAEAEGMTNVGAGTAAGVKAVIENLRLEIPRIKDMSAEEVMAETAGMTYSGDVVDDFAAEHLLGTGHLPMLYIAGKILGEMKKRKGKFALLDMVAPFRRDAHPLSPDEAAEKKGMTPASVRSSTESQARWLSSGPGFYGPLFSNLPDWKYLREKLRVSDIIYAGNVRELLEGEPCNLSTEYLLCLVYILMGDEYVRTGRRFFESGVMEKAVWANTYLVSKDLAERFDMEAFRRFVEKTEDGSEVCQLLTVEYMLSGYMGGAVRRDAGDKERSVREAARLVLTLEMGKEPDAEGRFTLEKRGKTLPQKALREMLEEKGEPMTLDEVFSRLKEKFPGKIKSVSSISTVLRSAPDIKRLRNTDLVTLSKKRKPADLSVREIIGKFLIETEPRETPDVIRHVQSCRPEVSENYIRTLLSKKKYFARRGRKWTVRQDGGYDD